MTKILRIIKAPKRSDNKVRFADLRLEAVILRESGNSPYQAASVGTKRILKKARGIGRSKHISVQES